MSISSIIHSNVILMGQSLDDDEHRQFKSISSIIHSNMILMGQTLDDDEHRQLNLGMF